MKNFLFSTLTILGLFFGIQSSNAQAVWGGATDLVNQITRNGTVAIGWNTPYPASAGKLMVNGDVNIYPGVVNGGNIALTGDIKGQANAAAPAPSGFNIFMNSTPGDGASLQSQTSGNGMLFTAKSTGGMRHKIEGTGQIDFWTATSEMMRLKSNGLVTIGGATVGDAPTGFKLSVGGGIITQQVKVCPSASTWCDYVFEKDYNRNPIDYVAKYVAENKHLPNVPSAQEVGENGLNVAEMDAVLLRQVEEIWLHLIDLKKENENLKSELSAIKAGLDKH